MKKILLTACALSFLVATSLAVDPPRDAAGSQVQVRARYSARFSSKAARSDQSFPVNFIAVVQRDAGGWHIASIR